jgi:hypothetical protein
VPFDTSGSRIYQVIKGRGEEDIMPPPPYSLLTSQQIKNFGKWIMQGALNSDCPQAGCDTTGTISFKSQVISVLQPCLSCHSGTSPLGGVNLSDYSNVKVYADNLRNGIPVLVGAINQMSGFFAMPLAPSSKLDKCSIRKIELWIQQKELNN